ncbi:hypothetical protein QOT17_004443 [Balamuthia mandrillaris]
MQMRGLFVLVVIGVVFTARTLAQNSCGGEARITETTILRSDCSGSHASGFVDEQTTSSYITASAKGAYAHGYAVDGYLEASSEGAFVAGNVNDATIVAADSGSIALGYASSGGRILSSSDGALARGYATSGARIESGDSGALAGGYATDGGLILADNDGAVALGYVPLKLVIMVPLPWDMVIERVFCCYPCTAENFGRLESLEDGSFALGYVCGSPALDNSSISATGDGAFALGNAGDNARILATNEGSFAAGIGLAEERDLASEHLGAIALGINVATSFDGQTVVGICNDPAVDLALDTAFSVGVGAFSTASGCTASDTGLVVDNQGNLYVKGNVFVQGATISPNQANGMRRSSDDINTEDLQTQGIRSSRTTINLMEAVERIALLEAKLCKLVGDCPHQAAN